MDELCRTRSMSVFEWIDIAKDLGVDGLELYPGFLLSDDKKYLKKVRDAAFDKGLSIPMFCVSPDFTVSDPVKRQDEVDKYLRILDMASFFGCGTCRILSGQAYPDVSRDDGIKRVIECINRVLEPAALRGIVLVMENHYKDNYWSYPEFAQPMDIFLEILDKIDSPWLGVNYDPSNAVISGYDPIILLESVKERIVTMHASDRYLKNGGSIEDMNKQTGKKGYPDMLVHGEIGRGLNDYDMIFSILNSVGFDGWISIEDGINGIDELKRSVKFLREKIKQHF